MKTVGVIGLGSIGMRHAKNLKAMGLNVVGFDPVMIGDGFPSMWPVARIGELDAIVIASPTYRHYDDIYACLQRNMNVFVEKPIAHSLEEPLDPSLLRQVKMVGYNLRFHGCVKKAKEWLDSGKIGKPVWANFTLGQHSEKPPYLRDGVILNWSHEIDLALYLLGDATVKGSNTLLRDGKDTMSDILLTHKGDHCQSTIHLDYLTEPEHRYFKIVGSLGWLSVDLVASVALLRPLSGEAMTYIGSHNWNDTYIEEIQAFLDRCDGKETIGCSGKEGLKVLKICLEVRKKAGLI